MKMESPDSPFLEPKELRYRKEREEIETAIENELEDARNLKRMSNEFFGLNHESELLEDEERKDFKIFARHAIKRLLNVTSQREGDGVLAKLKHINEGKKEKEEWGRIINLKYRFVLLYHDLSHVAGTIITERYKLNNNSIIPPLFEFKRFREANNREVMENELYGLFWDSIVRGDKEINLTLDILSRSISLPIFIHNYVHDALKLTAHTNYNALGQIHLRTLDENFDIKEKMKEGDDILFKIEEDPPEELIKMLTYVWEHKDSPRVLADVFFKEVGPYIDELKKRKTYQK